MMLPYVMEGYWRIWVLSIVILLLLLPLKFSEETRDDDDAVNVHLDSLKAGSDTQD